MEERVTDRTLQNAYLCLLASRPGLGYLQSNSYKPGFVLSANPAPSWPIGEAQLSPEANVLLKSLRRPRI